MDKAIGLYASDMVVRLQRMQTERVKNKRNPPKELKKIGTVGKESKVLELFEEN